MRTHPGIGASGLCLLVALATLTAAPPATAQLNIVLVPNATLSGNAPALAAFERAALSWEARFSDPITVVINAGLSGTLPAGTIGQASTSIVSTSYTNARNLLIADAGNESSNGIVASLP